MNTQFDDLHPLFQSIFILYSIKFLKTLFYDPGDKYETKKM